MKMFSWVPNFLTICNLLCGCAAIFALFFGGDFTLMFWLIVAAAVFDFADGFAARMLKAYSPMGKELDSLADMVSFGVAPGFMAASYLLVFFAEQGLPAWLGFVGLALAAFAALRLAKFNIDERQSEAFIGVPTPAMTLFFVSYFVTVQGLDTPYYELIGYSTLAFVALFSFLMVCEVPFFSFKFKKFSFKGNEVRYIFALFTLASVVFFGYTAPMIVILAYVLVSLVMGLVCRRCRN